MNRSRLDGVINRSGAEGSNQTPVPLRTGACPPEGCGPLSHISHLCPKIWVREAELHNGAEPITRHSHNMWPFWGRFGPGLESLCSPVSRSLDL